jgi:Putative peptidoglycan binding domain
MNNNKLILIAVISAFSTGCTTLNTNTGLVDTSSQYAANDKANTPPSAKPGECYINLHNKPITEEVSQQVLKTAASKTLEVVPAVYETVEETIMVKPATKRLEIVPAVYETVEERVMVKPASKKLIPVDAVYEDQSEQVLVTPASTYWKRSTVAEAAASGAKEQIAGDDGYVMCLIEKPAVYKTVTKTIMSQAPTTRVEEVPAEYGIVQKTVLKTPETTREIEIPAEYATVQKTQLVTPATEKVTDIPAEYDTVTTTRVVSEGNWEWRQILCATNSTPTKLQDIESALSAAGHNPGNVDGIVDHSTLQAIRSYQSEKGLPLDRGRYINIDTVNSLGISAS